MHARAANSSDARPSATQPAHEAGAKDGAVGAVFTRTACGKFHAQLDDHLNPLIFEQLYAVFAEADKVFVGFE